MKKNILEYSEYFSIISIYRLHRGEKIRYYERDERGMIDEESMKEKFDHYLDRLFLYGLKY